MSKSLKDIMTQSLRRRYEGVDSACVVELTGMDVIATTKLRGNLRAKNIRMEVVKNSIARRAFSDGPLGPLGDRLTGPCALVTGGGSAVDLARTLTELLRDFQKLKLREAVVERDVLTVEALSKMKGKRELIGEVAMLISSPGRALAGCLAGPQSKIAGCLKAIGDKEEAAA